MDGKQKRHHFRAGRVMYSKHRIAVLVAGVLTVMAINVRAAGQGPDSSQPPYMKAIAPGIEFASILSTGDTINGYTMAGIPDGMGAYDNADGTFTVLMNHEIPADSAGPVGIVRAHGGKGAFVSEWVIDKRTLKVISGVDLMRNVYRLDAGNRAWTTVPATGILGKTSSFARFCSADMADRSAFFNAATGKGSPHRIYLNGEEDAPTYQRALAHVATGPDKGNSYVLPWSAEANGAWENLLANPYSGDNTVVIGNSDGGSNGVYVYVGKKRRTGGEARCIGCEVEGRLRDLFRQSHTLQRVKALDEG